jgi:small subunit ribosomal protein S5
MINHKIDFAEEEEKILSSESDDQQLEEQLVFVNRCAKVIKGGRHNSFGAVVVVGNRNGLVGYGYGKANEVADAVRKGIAMAKKSLIQIRLKDRTIPHEVWGKSDGAIVYLKPASPGTGVIAGGAMRPVLELAGIKDVLAKSLGRNNKLNVVKATIVALQSLIDPEIRKQSEKTDIHLNTSTKMEA